MFFTARIPPEIQDPVGIAEPHRARIPFGSVPHDDLPVDSGQANNVRQDEGFRGEVLGERFAGTAYPFPVLFDERPDGTGAGSFRYDDFDAAARKDLYGQSLGARTLAHRKARRLAGLVVFGFE